MKICIVLLLVLAVVGGFFFVIAYVVRKRREGLRHWRGSELPSDGRTSLSGEKTLPSSARRLPTDEQALPSGQIVSGYNVRHLDSRDQWLRYSSDLHRYTFNDIPLCYVDEAVEACFPPFRTVELSEKVALRTGESAVRVRERWEAESEEALKLGRFLHRQIENVLQRRPLQFSFYYRYVGKEYAVNRTTSIHREMNQYVQFRQDFPALRPYRSLWVVYDEDARLAGVADFLARDADGYFVLIDWKRSRTFGKECGSDFVLSDAHGRTGLDVVSSLPDTPFWHEALRLNLLRLVLKRRYHLVVDRLQVLLLHADNASYHLLDVPLLSDEAEAVLQRLSAAGDKDETRVQGVQPVL